MGLTPEQEARDCMYAAEHHCAENGLLMLPVETIASVIETLHDAQCSFFACPGPTREPIEMASCSSHAAYADLRDAVGDGIRYVRDGHASVGIDTYLLSLSTTRYGYRPALAER